MPKKTVLGDEAFIYQHRKELSEKEKLKSMKFAEKLAYLWEYYKIHAFAIIIALALIIYIIYKIVTPNVETQIYAAVINNPIEDFEIKTYQKDLSKYLHLDSKTEDVYFNTSFYYNSSKDYSLNMKTVLMTYISAQDVDVIIAPEKEFNIYAYKGYFDELSDRLPTDLYSSLTDQFYLTNKEGEVEKNVYGIYLNNSNLFKNVKQSERYVIGIVTNSRHKDNSIEMIRYLFHTNQSK